jgi:hypothetical protein
MSEGGDGAAVGGAGAAWAPARRWAATPWWASTLAASPRPRSLARLR